MVVESVSAGVAPPLEVPANPFVDATDTAVTVPVHVVVRQKVPDAFGNVKVLSVLAREPVFKIAFSPLLGSLINMPLDTPGEKVT